MRTKLKKISALITLSFLLLGLLVAMLQVNYRVQSAQAASAGPQLSIQSNIPADPNSTVVVPVQFTSNGSAIASTVFSIDYDQTWLSFDNSIPNAVDFTVPSNFAGSCSHDASDTDGELDCFIIHPSVPLGALPDGIVLNVTLRTKNPPNTVVAKAGFSLISPPTSFGSTEGQSVPGTTLDGSVQVGEGVPVWLYLPVIIQNLISPPTPVPTITPEPTVTPTDLPPGCTDAIVNSGFENDTGWKTPATFYTAGYSTDKPRNGLRSMRTGIVDENDNTFSYSSARQMVTIPSNATSANLSIWVYPISGETTTTQSLPIITLGELFGTEEFEGDFQYILILDQYNNVIATLDVDLSNSQTWTHKSFDLSNYIGWYPIKIHFGTYNNGTGGITAMYVDDVSVKVCK
jgi:hypothetical protein